jgi:hypothetical protein
MAFVVLPQTDRFRVGDATEASHLVPREAPLPMWSRSAARPVLARSAVVGLAVVACSGLGLSAAGAAPSAATVALSPTHVDLSVHADQVGGTQRLASKIFGRGHEPVAVAFGGTVTFQLPAQVTPAASPLVAELTFGGADGGSPVRTYSSASTDPTGLLVLTDLGAGRYQVTLPADDGVSGSVANLQLSDLVATAGAGVSVVHPGRWALGLSAEAPAAAELTSQLIAYDFLGCDIEDSLQWAACPSSATVTAGRTFDVTLPADSALVALGLPDLTQSAFSVELHPDRDMPDGGDYATLPATLSADARTATLTFPADLPAGSYLLNSGVMDSTGRVFASIASNLTVEAPAVNPGLRSETGADDDQSVLPAALGGVLVLAAAGAVLRTRRQQA